MEQSKFTPLTEEQYNSVCESAGLPPKFAALLDYVYRARSCTLVELIEKFPDLCETGSPIDYLSIIGRVNGKIFSKQLVALYPSEVSSSMEGSVFSLGIMSKIKKQKGGLNG